MEFNLLDILILISLSQGIIFGLVVLMGQLFKNKTNKFLAYSVILISIIGLEKWLSMWGFEEKYLFVDIFGDDIPWILLFFVPLLIYFLKSVKHPLANSLKLWFLTIPFFIFLILNAIIDLDIDFGWINAPFFIQNMLNIYIVEDYLAFAYSLFLCSLSYYVIHHSKKTANSKWLKTIWFIVLLLHIIWLLLFYTPETVLNTNMILVYLLWLGVSFFIYFLSYKGLYQMNLVQNQAAVRELLKQRQNFNNKTSIKRSSAESTEGKTSKNVYLSKLMHLMGNEHLYRDPDIGLDIIADKIDISVSYLSQLINSSLDKNFTSYINFYRVRDVKNMLLDPDFNKYSILSIGLEAGFKSKSAFYNIFKKETGLTPNQYKNSVNKS